MQEVYIEQEECIGCEACVELCPEVFAFDSDLVKAFVIMSTGGDQKCIDEAIASCPVSCISMMDV